MKVDVEHIGIEFRTEGSRIYVCVKNLLGALMEPKGGFTIYNLIYVEKGSSLKCFLDLRKFPS